MTQHELPAWRETYVVTGRSETQLPRYFLKLLIYDTSYWDGCYIHITMYYHNIIRNVFVLMTMEHIFFWGGKKSPMSDINLFRKLSDSSKKHPMPIATSLSIDFFHREKSPFRC